ncbi:MAG: chondroitinase-B domain-containing protein [Pseudomonadota bacterium]
MSAISSRFVRRTSLAALFTLGASAALASYILEYVGVLPRQLAPYVERRAAGHNPFINEIGRNMASTLQALDRGAGAPASAPAWRIGAQDTSPAHGAGGHVVPVASTEAVLRALAEANPGDVITLQPGTYRFQGRYIAVTRAGSAGAPITLRAERPGTVSLDFALGEGFHVTAPYWTFENLHIRGACERQADCNHAFHVTGKAAGFIARNNTLLDFNAHLKINSEDGDNPDRGLIEGNTLSNTSVRQTGEPVTPIDLVGAGGWIIRANLISDFVKGGGNQVSYGAFAKGAGSGNVFERNIVLCEQRLRGQPGQRIGLSLGGGGTGAASCRDKRCITEQDGGVIQSNLIASCSDEGIYLNRAAASKVLHNTLLDTAGIMVRFAESSADVQGNIVDGRIRARNGALLRAQDNLDSNLTSLYLGRHAQRALFRAPAALDFGFASTPAHSRSEAGVPDLCGPARAAQPLYGAFDDFAACLRH